MGEKGRSGSGRRDTAVRRVEEYKERPRRPGAPGQRPTGRLLVIGGHEDRKGDRVILRRLAEQVGDGKLVVATLASGAPDGMFETYEPLFRALGVRHVYHLPIESRADAEAPKSQRILDDATVVFFTGGDQLRITSQIGDSPVYSRIFEIFEAGGTIAGTSAGASVMSETMIVGGGSNGSHRLGPDLQLAPGLGLAKDMVIDQHFAERGRISRLLAVVAQNPRIIGIGIDEDTAIELEPFVRFRVIGAGGVYVVDGRDVVCTNVAEEDTDRTLSIHGVTLHLLSQGDEFDLDTREPTMVPARVLEEKLGIGDARDACDADAAGD